MFRCWPAGYRGSAFASLCRSAPVAGLAVALALGAGGCSLSYQLDSLSARKTEAEHTGSTRLAPPPKAESGKANAGDIAATRAAINEALAKPGKDVSVPWENPSTGARGTITPLSAAYVQNGNTCRDFLASYVRNGAESWMQGEACRGQQGRWVVRNVKPWRRT